jgi:ABC-type antimicrobial peptide transport system permease subunit
VVTESAVLGVLGAAAGVLLASVGGWAVAEVMRRRLGLVVDPRMTLNWVVLVGMGTLLLAALAGVVPAVMAYRTSVARNLRPLG